jgi:hypothetical protein
VTRTGEIMMDTKPPSRQKGLQETIGVANYSELEVLRDGTAMLIRAIRPDDKHRLLQHFNGLSAQSIYYRFFGIKRSLTEDHLARLTS